MRLVAGAVRRRIVGLLLVALGIIVLTMPLLVGRWSLAIIGLSLIIFAFVEAYAAFTSPRSKNGGAYLSTAIGFLAGNILLLSPALSGQGLLILLIVVLTVDGLGRIAAGFRDSGTSRLVSLFNGLFDLACAATIWYLSRFVGIVQAIGIIVGAYMVAAGWRTMMTPDDLVANDNTLTVHNAHPDPRLGIPANDHFAILRRKIDEGSHFGHAEDLLWMSTLGIVFLAIHAGRMPLTDDVLGRISPFVATVGDALMTLVFATMVMLPARLAWRRLSRPAERLAWGLWLDAKRSTARINPLAESLVRRWLESRFQFSLRLREARASLPLALMLMIRLGLPVTAFFVAFNPAWGFSWYFNTESWATGIYQKLTELRVDQWRANMVDAVTRAYAADDGLFRIEPQGVAGNGDFSFLVIGDPGEGDPSQYSLTSRYLQLGHNDDVKFLIISSDVIYPAGAIDDYEAKFYQPFHGFAKPIYAIPGNHDWFDALEGFNATFLEPRAAQSAMHARVKADLGLTGTNARRIDDLISRSERLRGLYALNTGLQRAPFFELQTEDFAFLAIDTGILRSVDERQLAWVQRALDRSRGKFTMALVGHPRIAGGHDVSTMADGQDTVGSTESFASLYRLLATRGVKIVMAGDTHDFEYYRDDVARDGTTEAMHHFVNGGGGAYLSIGTALDFPQQAATRHWAYYPRTDQVRAKLDAETPLWKRPFWYWIKWLNAWPFSVEAFSGIFDFNRAPFFQSFVEVRVERSRKRVVLILNGVNGPLQWRDLQTSDAVLPPGAQLDDRVEFVIPMDRK